MTGRSLAFQPACRALDGWFLDTAAHSYLDLVVPKDTGARSTLLPRPDAGPFTYSPALPQACQNTASCHLTLHKICENSLPLPGELSRVSGAIHELTPDLSDYEIDPDSPRLSRARTTARSKAACPCCPSSFQIRTEQLLRTRCW